MTSVGHPVSVLSEGLGRFEVLVGEFRQLVEAGLALRSQVWVSNGGATSLSRASRYEVHTARLPHLGHDVTALNSELRASLFVGAGTHDEPTNTTRPAPVKAYRHDRRRAASNALDLRATISANAQ